MKNPIVIAIDGTSASGKSTNARRVAQALQYAYVDTGAMYRTLAWHCLQRKLDIHDAKAVGNACRRWKTELKCVEDAGMRSVRLYVDGYYPEKEIRTAETSAAVPHVAAVLDGLSRWMDGHGYASIGQMRGAMSQKSVPDPSAYARAGYMKVLGSYR